MELKLSRPGFWMAVLLVVVALAIQTILAIPLGIIDAVLEVGLHKPRLNLATQPWIVGCINLASFGAAIALGLFLNRIGLRKAFPFVRITAAQATYMVISVMGLSIALSEVDNAFRALLLPPRLLLTILQNLFFNEHSLAARVFFLVIVAPLTEGC